jgi:hypothetical protein
VAGEPPNPGDPLEARLQFLRKAGTGTLDHSGRTLLEHLIGTRALLKRWGAGPALSDAGLFHAVYGTEAYREAAVPPEGRAEIRGLIANALEPLHCLRPGPARRAALRWLRRNLLPLGELRVAPAREELLRVLGEEAPRRWWWRRIRG